MTNKTLTETLKRFDEVTSDMVGVDYGLSEGDWEIIEKFIKSSIKDALEAVRVEKLYNPKVSAIWKHQLPTERFEDYSERMDYVWRDKDRKYGFNMNTTQYDENVRKYLED